MDFDDFFVARGPALRRTAYLVVGDWQDAEDVGQAAFVKLYRVWPRLRQESVEAYARRAVVNTSISHARKRRPVTVEQVPEASRTVADGGHESTSTAELLQTLAVLPPAQRAVIALRFLDDLSVAQTATAMGISAGTVKSHTSRALTALRQYLPEASSSTQQQEGSS